MVEHKKDCELRCESRCGRRQAVVSFCVALREEHYNEYYGIRNGINRQHVHENFGIPSRWNLFPRVPLRRKCTRRLILLCRIEHTYRFFGVMLVKKSVCW